MIMDNQKEVRIQQLFSNMQAAERNKDIDPIAYQKARIAYYRLSQGESWIAKEEASLGIQADQKIAVWRNQYTALQGLRTTHQTNLDIVRGAETKQSGFGDDFKYAVGELKRIVQNDKDASLLTAREAYLRQVQYGPPGWALYTLDGLIIILLLYAIYSAYSRFGIRWSATGALIANQRAMVSQRKFVESMREQLS